MNQILQSPGKYIQGFGIFKELARNISKYGNKALYIIANRDVDTIKMKINDSYEKLEKWVVTQEDNEESSLSEYEYTFEIFDGECSNDEILRVKELCLRNEVEVVIGIGSGKLHDTVKAVGYYAQLPVVIVPTIAASDAPCSSMSVINTKEGLFEYYLYLNQNPNLVFVDIDFIINAPERLIVAGMGDALSTYFEARACQKSGSILPNGMVSSDIAFQLSKLCYENLLKYGAKAKQDVIDKVNSIAVEKIVESNTYLSGVGFESGGLAAAHAINDGLSKVVQCNQLLHGEKVAFATLVQLVLEKSYYNNYCNIDISSNGDIKNSINRLILTEEITDYNNQVENYQMEINQVLAFCTSVGLPVTLKSIGVDKEDSDTLNTVIANSLLETEPIHHMEFKVSNEMLYDAIIEADKLGNLFINKTK